MHSLRGWLLVAGGFLGVRGAVLPPSAPAITPAPQPEEAIVRMLQHRQDPNPISLAQVLLTALPLSLRIIAVTNIPAVSSILWEEFLDDKKPEWFLDLPEEIQSYLIVQFGPETAWPTAATTNDGSISQATTTATDQSSETGSSATDSASTDTASASPSGSESFSTVSSSTASISGTVSSSRSSPTSAASTNPSSSPSADVQAPPMSNAGLSREQKIGIGVGIPLGLLGLAALFFGCCFLLRRRRKRRDDGTEPPGSPGFIPRFSFQAEPTDYQTPLNPGHTHNHPSRFVEDMNEDEQSYEAAAIAASHGRDTFPPGGSSAGPTQPMSMHDPQPIMAPLLHTHSSRKARGKRTSYTSLHSVAEVTEPDDEMAESPILGRRNSPPKTGPRRPSIPSVLEMPPTPTAAAIKRKPVATSPTSSPAADAASRSLLRPSLAATTMANHSGSSSSGMAISSNSSSNSGFGHKTNSPVSPITDHTPVNPFSNDYAYLEDYGPEYSYNGYDDYDGGMYGGNRSLDRYPDLPAPRRYNSSSKTEWPLRNVFGSVKRNKSPMWDRVYESP